MTFITIGKLLSQLHNYATLSAQEVSSILQAEYSAELSSEMLLDYESGYSPININLFIALCKIYHCNDILNALNYRIKKEGPFYLSSEEQQIITNYRKLPLEEKNIILGALNIKKESYLQKIA